jgi:uncharacterized membrane protein YedE/YeeE
VSDFTPVSALAGGALIGASASLLLLFRGRIAGISGIVDASLASPRDSIGWRLPFLAGMIVVGVVAHLAFPSAIGPSIGGFSTVAAAGLLVGFGTRLGNGCTSGHGVVGLARLSKRSLVATLTFIAFGMLTTWLVLHARGAA